ncbi:hypothetical protein GH5_04873 [Leishmania sp. Ghana 2012 LV757]|uniref:hypothetical protein n=1 Tax=Leishmania sp. Ghana 2012 LV757 TaxID=2803181 RepID=UPI001B68587C|nr:hypothetical protein GH5_04873 [Leishmania sp. Ghana 2012 LV757]
MAHVYLLDVSYLASFEDWLPQSSSAPPLSWRCAAELTQWTSLAAVKNAWAAACAETAAVTPAASASAHDKFVTSAAAPCGPEREGYMRLSMDEDGEETKAAALSTLAATEAGALTGSMYAIHTFPSAVRIQNKYFSAALTLVTGAPLRPPSCYGNHCFPAADLCDITADLLRRCPAGQGCSREACISHDSDVGGYGGVLLARITQDPADIPWHAFPQSGCLFHVIMVFCDSVTGVYRVATAAPESLAAIKDRLRTEDADVCCGPLKEGATPRENSIGGAAASLQERKERWKYFAAENGYECIFHTAVCPPCAAAHMAGPVEHDGGEAGNTAADAQLESVSIASGVRGFLEAPLAGSNRLYQILCNTLWPAGVRRPATTASGTRSDGHGGEESDAATQKSKSLKPPYGNAFVVVCDDEEAVWRLFQWREDGCARTLRRRLRFFTSAVRLPGQPTAEGRHTRVALVNRYYAAVVQPRLVQTAFFDVRMQELLDRYWEQHITAENGSGDLCPDAPAVVLWPPTTSASRSVRSEREARSTAAISADADDEGVRGSYPPLEVILDSLARLGCRDVVVMVSERRGGAVLNGLTEYEALMCEQRSIEVVQLDPARCTAASDGAVETDVNGPPVPAIREDGDIWATHGADRLHELLHCVKWGQAHLMASAASPTGRLADCRHNSGLLLVCGRTPSEEEAWVRDVLEALSAAPSSTRSKSATVCAEDYLRLAAPTVAAALGVALRRDTADLGGRPARAVAEVNVSNSYFHARVDVYVEGGLQSYYTAPPPQLSGTRAMPPGWDDAHDAYVVVTNLCTLQKAAHAVAESPRHTADNDLCSAEIVGGAQGILGRVISTLSRRQKEEWLAEQIEARVAHSTSQKVPNIPADTPLVLLYIADVLATDTGRVELAEQLLSTLARRAAGGAATPQRENSSASGDVDDGCVPIELVFASDPLSLATGAATTGCCAGLVVEGTARVREAFEQHVWPHRHSRPHLRRRASSIPPDILTKELAASPRGSAEAVSSTTPDSFVDRGTPKAPPSGAPASAAVAGVSVTTKASAVVPREARTVDIPWLAPIIGCALPSDFLVDPETLRSVPVRAVRDALWNAERIADVNPLGVDYRQSGDEAPAQHRKPLPQSHNEEELMQWMEKMKRYGHRLGESLRKEQAEVLALALEKIL